MPTTRHNRFAAPANPAAAPDTIGEQLTLMASKQADWRALDAASDQLACGLLGLKLQRGDCIAVVGLAQPDVLALVSAAAKLGVVVLGLSLGSSDAALAMVLVHSQAKAVFSPQHCDGVDAIALLQRLGARAPALRHVIPTDGSGLNSLAALAATPLEVGRLSVARRRVAADDVALLVYADSDGRCAEATAISHRSLLASTPQAGGHISLRGWAGWGGWGQSANSAAAAAQNRPHQSPR